MFSKQTLNPHIICLSGIPPIPVVITYPLLVSCATRSVYTSAGRDSSTMPQLLWQCLIFLWDPLIISSCRCLIFAMMLVWCKALASLQI